MIKEPSRRGQRYDTDSCRKAHYWQRHETVGQDVKSALDWALEKLKRSKSDPNFAILSSLRSRLEVEEKRPVTSENEDGPR